MSSALFRAANLGLQRHGRRHVVRSFHLRAPTHGTLFSRNRPNLNTKLRPNLPNFLCRSFFWSDDKDGDGSDGNGGDNSSGKGDDVEPVEPLEPASSEPGSTALAGQAGGDRVPPLETVIALPMTTRPLFPGLGAHILVRDEQTIAMLREISDKGLPPYVGVFLTKEEPTEEYIGVMQGLSYINDPIDVDALYDVGTFAQIMRVTKQGDDGVLVFVQGHRRIQRRPGPGPAKDKPIINVDHLYLPQYDPQSDNIRMYTNEILSTLREITTISPLFREQVQFLAQNMNLFDPARIADLATSLTTSRREELQDILCTLDAEERLQKMLDIVKEEHQRAITQQEIAAQVEQKMSSDQRQYFLREQLKSIKKELGLEKDDKDAVLQRFQDRLNEDGITIPEEVQATLDDEIEKFTSLEKNSSEYNVTRNYLDWLTSIPWGKHTDDVFDVDAAATILDRDHYGMAEVKDRILEFVAVGKLRGQVQGKILCLVGPPGVGKTSIGSAIGRCIGREFQRFSVGGMSDVSEIKGHRRTYVGAMPGKLVQSLKMSGVSNPVILIDEIDKLGHGGMNGDPASALLEVLDPSQNSTFMDHYLDVPVDLSKVLFVCTANSTDTIPGPLLDRMEVVRLPGYDSPEKVSIATQYLVPKTQAATGLSGESEVVKGDEDDDGSGSSTTVGPHTKVTISDDALNQLIKGYCREAGVRVLERKIETIFRKVALKVVKDPNPPSSIEVQESDLVEYIGQPIFNAQRMYDQTPVGVVMGLAWNTMGGSTLYIEAASSGAGKEKAGLQVTGNMKEVMRESTQIALTCAKIKLSEWASNIDFLDTHALHLHVPEGATPKDGPSAGCTMVTALLSLALNRSVRDDLAMTGEISLTGRILPVGGIREKVIAARREGVKCLVLPKGNEHDFKDLPEYLQEGLEVHFAEHYDDVFDVAFCEDGDMTF